MISTIGSVLVDGSPFDTKLLVYCVDNHQAVHETFTTLDQWFVWSLCELALGHFLDKDPFNRDHQPFSQGRRGRICGPWKGIVVVHKGDEKYIHKAYGMTHSWISKFICFRCKAESQGPNCYSTYGEHAPHRRTMMDTDQFIEGSCHGGCPWIRLPGWSVEMLANDWLHVVDLAVSPECCASVPCFHLLSLVLFHALCQLSLCVRVGFERVRHLSRSPGQI